MAMRPGYVPEKFYYYHIYCYDTLYYTQIRLDR